MSVYFVDKSYGYEENMKICHLTNVNWAGSPSERYSTWDYCILSGKSDIVDNKKQIVAARLSVEAKSLAMGTVT